jgi:hypothetical protein
MHDDTIWIEVPSMLVVAPNGRLKFAMPCVTSPESTAHEMVTGNVAALLELANAKVNTGAICLKYESGFFLLNRKYMGQ